MQTPKSILLHLDSSERVADRIRLARSLAENFDAQVTAQACRSLDLVNYPYRSRYTPDTLVMLEELSQDERDGIFDVFSSIAGDSPRMHWAEPLEEGPDAFARRALYADLLLLGQRDPEDPVDGELPANFLSSLLVQSGKPGLVLPYVDSGAAVGRNVLIAWKETSEAARAVSAALPWLRQARQVHAVAYGADASRALEDLRGSLRLRGVASVDLHPCGPGKKDVGDGLLSRAAEWGADLLVMGCYGHSRAREWLMGGATRVVLQSMTIPVLMSH